MSIFTRVAAVISSLMVFSSTVSYAASFNSTDGKLSLTDADKTNVNTQSSMFTVLVVNADSVNDLGDLSDAEILYVDQGSAIDTFTNMGIKNADTLTEGTYAMYIGSNVMSKPSVEYFYVKNTSETDDASIGLVAKEKKLNAETKTYECVYVAEITNFDANYPYGMKLSYKVDEKDYSYYVKLPDDATLALSQIEGEAACAFGVGVSNLPSEVVDTFTVIPCIYDAAVTNQGQEVE